MPDRCEHQVAVGRLGGPLAILVDALSFLVSALLVRRVRHVETEPDRARDGGGLVGIWDEMREGAAWVWGHPHLRGNGLAALIFNFFGGIAQVRHLIGVLQAACDREGRDRRDITVTKLGTLVIAETSTVNSKTGVLSAISDSSTPVNAAIRGRAVSHPAYSPVVSIASSALRSASTTGAGEGPSVPLLK